MPASSAADTLSIHRRRLTGEDCPGAGPDGVVIGGGDWTADGWGFGADASPSGFDEAGSATVVAAGCDSTGAAASASTGPIQR